jgi:hypothetical protein
MVCPGTGLWQWLGQWRGWSWQFSEKLVLLCRKIHFAIIRGRYFLELVSNGETMTSGFLAD